MPIPEDSNFQQLIDSIKQMNDRAEVARREGNQEILRKSLERKRHLENRLTFLKRAQGLDDEYYRKHQDDA